jgi:hypothetical protein
MFLTHMPSVTVTEDIERRIRNGQKVYLPDLSDAKLVKVFTDEVTLIAICERIAGPLFKPKVVL